MKEDVVAYGDFFRAHYVDVLRFIERRVGDSEDAAELAADVFRVAWQRFDPGGERSRGWLFGIARNVVLEHYRKTGRRRAAARRYEEELAFRAGPQEEDVDHPVHEALERLPEQAQEVLRLRYWDDLAIAEIAQVLGITQVSVRVRLHRARARIRTLMPTRRSPEGET